MGRHTRKGATRSRRRNMDGSYGDQVPFALELFPERDWGHVVLDSADMERIRRAIAQDHTETPSSTL